MVSNRNLVRDNLVSDQNGFFWKKIFQTILIVLPVIFLTFLIAKNGVNVPFMDQWELVPLIEKMKKWFLEIFSSVLAA